MRALNLINRRSALVLVFASYGVQSADLNLSTSFSKQSVLDSSLVDSQTDTRSTQIEVSNIALGRAWSTSASFNILTYEPDTLGLLDETQQNLFEAGESQIDTEAAASLAFQKVGHSHSISITQSLPSSLVTRTTVVGVHGYSFNNQGSQLYFDWAADRLESPQSFFLDFDFNVAEREAVSRSYELGIALEQSLTADLKLRARGFQLRKPDLRPTALGYETALAYAPFYDHFFKVSWSQASEDRSQSLLNERGYLSYYNLGFEWTYEVGYQNSLTLGASTQVETEDNPQNSTTRQIGRDLVALGFGFALDENLVNTSFQISNDNLREGASYGLSLSVGRTL